MPGKPILVIAEWVRALVSSEDIVAIDTTEVVDLHSVTCTDCGEAMDTHGCPTAGVSGPPPAPVLVRSTGPRKKATDHPACEFCGGRMHWSNGGAIINFECMYRQYLLAKNLITDPNARLPLFIASTAEQFGDWVAVQIVKGDFNYGKSAAGAGTYSALRPKAPPKPVKTEEEKAEAKAAAAAKRKSAKASKSITEVAGEIKLEDLGGEDLAGDDDDELEAPVPTPARSHRKPSPKAASNGTATATAEAPVAIDEDRQARREKRLQRMRELQNKK